MVLENAQKWLEKADRTHREHFSIQLNHYSDILKIYAKLQWEKKDFETAQKFLEYMMDNNINHITRNFSSLNQKEKEDFYDKIVTDLNLYFDRSIQYYYQKKDQAILQSILNRRISTKGFLLNDEQKLDPSYDKAQAESALVTSTDIENYSPPYQIRPYVILNSSSPRLH